MVDSWKSTDLSKLVINDHIIDYVLGKYGNNWQVDDAIVDEILDDLLKIEWEKKQRVKDDKGKGPLKDEKRKVKEKMDLNKGKEKMVMEKVMVLLSILLVSTDDTLNSRSEDTCSSDATWEQKKGSK
ncbi:hypothetical protein Tco_1204980, partial [Tanacetum coccineum]